MNDRTQIDKETNSNRIYPNSNLNKIENETIVTVRLPRTYYRSACAMAHLSGYTFEEYVNRAIRQKIKMEFDGAGELELELNVGTFYENIRQRQREQNKTK